MSEHHHPLCPGCVKERAEIERLTAAIKTQAAEIDRVCSIALHDKDEIERLRADHIAAHRISVDTIKFLEGEIERLRSEAEGWLELADKAADEIEGLRSEAEEDSNAKKLVMEGMEREIERLRTTLKYIAKGLSYNSDEHPAELDRARRALEEVREE